MTSDKKLAIYGGARAVTSEYKEKWRNVGFRAVPPLLKLIARDVNTSRGGSGPVAAFEKRFAAMTQTRYALAMNSGTATLHSAYFAVGVKPGTEVIVPSYTFFASVTPILQLGGTPVFCDIDERTLTADPDDVENRITPSTRAICVVHVFGNPAAMDRFVEIARHHDVALIEDASHAHGAIYKGQPIGSWGDVGCFSLQGQKAVSGGEAGVAVTNNPVLFDRMLALGHYGRVQDQQAAETFNMDDISLGLKYRPHLYGMVLALDSLSRLEELNRLRAHNYRILSERLENCPAVRPIESYPDAVRGGYIEFILRYKSEHAGGWSRDAFVKAAQAEGVPIYVGSYTQLGPNTRLLHESPVFGDMDLTELGGFFPRPQGNRIASAQDLPVTYRLADQLMTMPALTKVPERFVRECANALRKVAECACAIKDFRTGGVSSPVPSPTRGSRYPSRRRWSSAEVVRE